MDQGNSIAVTPINGISKFTNLFPAGKTQEINSNLLTIRSFLFPDEPIVGFQLGESFTMNVPGGITMEELIGKIYYNKFDQIGVMAVNGKLASAETILLSGDAIDFYPLSDGG